MKDRLSYILVILALMLTACVDDPEPQVPGRRVPVVISIPMDGADMSRAIGDPGTYEKNALPKHAYVYLVTYANPTDAESKTNAAVYHEHYVLSGDGGIGGEWEYDQEKSELYGGDSIYTYSDRSNRLTIFLPENKKVARAYVALSTQELTLSNGNPATEADVTDIYFTIPAESTKDARQDLLKNLYSTPANLTHPGDYQKTELQGKYYGTLEDTESNVPHIDLVCFHVAAKLDLKWEVAKDKQAANRLTCLQVNNLLNKGSLFQPVSNLAAANEAEGAYTEEIFNYTTKPEGTGTQWYGRQSIYVIYKKNRTTAISVKLGRNWINDAVNSYEKNLWDTAPTSNSEIYTPWLRALITINRDITTPTP